MHRGNRWIASLFVSAALVVPIGAMATPRPQDDHERQEREEHERRMYDQEHRDYHQWDEHEERMYREWLRQRNFAYIDFDQLTPRDQRAYWHWRHEKQEHEEREHEHYR
jgi:hypothetical protein